MVQIKLTHSFYKSDLLYQYDVKLLIAKARMVSSYTSRDCFILVRLMASGIPSDVTIKFDIIKHIKEAKIGIWSNNRSDMLKMLSTFKEVVKISEYKYTLYTKDFI